MDKLKEKLKDLPKQPGVYEFKNSNGEVIYVGKAKNLKNRVNQYFSGHDTREQIPYLMAEAADFEYTVVNSELESLYLENTLIKKYLPRYNIMLRDDKNYAFIKINYETEIPQIEVVRKVDSTISKAKSSLFGPYTAAYKIRSTLHLVRRIFPYCSAQKISTRPCFYYYLHRCPGVCVGKITLDEYKQQLEKICYFLSGRTAKVKQEVKVEMKAASAQRLFEKAAKMRDQLRSLELLDEKQTVILTKKVDWDIVSVAEDSGYACVNLFKVRDGKLFDKENFIYEMATELQNKNTTDAYRMETLQKFLEKYYLETSSIPKIIYTQTHADDSELVAHIVKSRFDKKVTITTPQKGKARELAKLGQTNAQEYLKNWLQSQAGHLDKINQALGELKDVLKLEKTPDRIECYDISNIQGTNAVGSMVVFEKGLPKKSEYRKFRIKTKKTPDDFAMMREMFSRRMARVSKSANQRISGSAKLQWPVPDLIVIDGGKGQLSAAVEILQATPYPLLPTIGLAKRIEEIFQPGKSDSIILPHTSPALQLLQRLRDEAHRFGITYHRSLRSKQAVRSALDDIPGIGPKTKKLLKQKFGTVANIRKTKFDDLSEIVGERIALLISQQL